MTTTTEFKIGDHIKKVFDTKMPNDTNIFEIMNIKEIKGGNWHDGFTLSFIATIELKTDEENVKPETDTEDYCIQYINYMCQINNVYAARVDE
jgi:hypothetical protein